MNDNSVCQNKYIVNSNTSIKVQEREWGLNKASILQTLNCVC